MSRDNPKYRDPFYEHYKVISTTDCTGLIPMLPDSHDEDENQAFLYAIHDALPED